MAQPVRVLHIVDSIAIVVEIVDVRDPVVVVVHVNCNLGFTIEASVSVVSIKTSQMTSDAI